jgi:hypothetical protein
VKKTIMSVNLNEKKTCGILGGLWLSSLFAYLFLGTITYAGGMPPLIIAGCTIAIVLWIISGVFLTVIFVRSTWLARSKAPAASLQAISRWFAAVFSGLLGGVAAHQVNHLFPGKWTLHSDWLPGMFLFSLVGMLVGAIPLAFPLKPRTTVILAFVFSATFSWLIIVNNFR